ncbi:hypothetical protein R3P38DRAFT_2590802 [Favolaschia claudopus]|uniref:Uncharacterized protein n=1 Tax=Favolaschia claudopus TaxID=2862362 RepID=A0AAV9YZH2_9AGAR
MDRAISSTIALALYEQGNLQSAEELDITVVEIQRQTLGKEHLDSLTTYLHQGRLREAEELDTKVFKATAELLGKVYPAILNNMANLAAPCLNQSNWSRAQELKVTVLKAILSKEHHDTPTSMIDVALTYRHYDRWGKPEALNIAALEARMQQLSREHFETLTSILDLAFISKNLGRWSKEEGYEKPKKLKIVVNQIE